MRTPFFETHKTFLTKYKCLFGKLQLWYPLPPPRCTRWLKHRTEINIKKITYFPQRLHSVKLRTKNLKHVWGWYFRNFSTKTSYISKYWGIVTCIFFYINFQENVWFCVAENTWQSIYHTSMMRKKMYTVKWQGMWTATLDWHWFKLGGGASPQCLA